MMYAGDEYYGDEITSGVFDDDDGWYEDGLRAWPRFDDGED